MKDRELSPYHKIVELEREVEEQARLNGMGSEREARLMARAAELERENAALRADKERMDWLEGQEGHYWAAKRLYRGVPATRAAIDAARKEAQP